MECKNALRQEEEQHETRETNGHCRNELERYGIDIAALSETRFAGNGQLTEKNYTFYWKGKDENEPIMHGVGFAVSNSLVTQLAELPVGISEPLMTLRVKLVDSRHLPPWIL